MALSDYQPSENAQQTCDYQATNEKTQCVPLFQRADVTNQRDSICPTPLVAATDIRITHTLGQDRIIRLRPTCPVYGLPLRIAFGNCPAVLSRGIGSVFFLLYINVAHNHPLATKLRHRGSRSGLEICLVCLVRND